MTEAPDTWRSWAWAALCYGYPWLFKPPRTRVRPPPPPPMRPRYPPWHPHPEEPYPGVFVEEVGPDDRARFVGTNK